MPNLGPTELIIILVIVVVLFGAGRIGKLGAELGSGIREFKKAVKVDDEGDTINSERADATE